MADWDRTYMELAVELSRHSRHEKDPNHPNVGVVVASPDGYKLGTGFHGGFGPCAHAEYGVLEEMLGKVALAGATVYSTLEPCSRRRHPRKVSCAHRLVERQVSRVFFGTLDPDPSITGKGYRILLEAKIELQTFEPDLVWELLEINRDFDRLFRPRPPGSETPRAAYVALATNLLAGHPDDPSLNSQRVELDDRTRQEFASRPQPYVDSRVEIWHVGCEPRGDTVELRYATHIDQGALSWRRIKVGASPGSGPTPQMSALNLEVFGEGVTGAIVDHGVNHIDIVVAFDPPIESDAREWGLRYRWPGLWDPLREKGEDSGIFALRPGCERIEQRIIFDPKMRNHPRQWSDLTPEVGTTTYSTDSHTLAWVIETPEPQKYRYRIRTQDGQPGGCT